jgi:multiple sugar transport system permease protein
MSTTSAARATTPRPALPPGLRNKGAFTRQMARVGWVYAAPALIVIAAVTIFPIVFSVIMSLSNVNVSSNGFTLDGFTLQNYGIVFTSQKWQYALYFTIMFTVVTVVIELVLGMLIALVLEKLVKLRGWMMAVLLIPWSMITVISAQLWNYIYDPTYGVADYLFHAMGLGNPVILGSPVSAIVAMVIADVWKTTPFVAILILAGLVMLPGDVYEAAEIDGSNGWKTFWQITVPLLSPTIALAVLFRVLQAFGVFDLPFVLTQGGPNGATTSLAILGYQVMFNNLQFGTGAAVAVTSALLVILGCLLFLRAFRSQVSDAEGN